MALKGVKVLELAGLAPAPFCGMVLSDFGAKVVRVDRVENAGIDFGTKHIVAHGKKSIALNFKTTEGIEALKRLSVNFDVLIDPYRPGVLEKLSLGPSDLMKLNSRLVYTRITGYGQTGPLAAAAGHDINFSAISGVLHLLKKRDGPPQFPVNILADFAGGGLTAALGTVLALYERQISGCGQVVDCSMTRGTSYVSSWLLRALGTYLFSNEPGRNLLDGGGFFYNTYRTKDGQWMAVGSAEPKFYSNLLKGLNLDETELPQTSDYDVGKKILEDAFAQQTQAYWINVFSKLDACVTPVLSPKQAAEFEHNVEQKNFDTLPDGVIAPTPEPRLSRTPSSRDPSAESPLHGQHTLEILKSVGYSTEDLTELLKKGAIGVSGDTSKL